MTNVTGTHRARLAVLVTALFAALPTAFAQEAEELGRLTKPQGNLELGLGYVSDDNYRFGQYSGLNEKGAYGLLDIDLNSRAEATGIWFRLQGRNLGLTSRELRVDYERQGDWGMSLELSQTPRYSPYIVNTTLTGIDTGVQTEGGTAARDLQLETRRDKLGLGLSKLFGSSWSANLRYVHEEKTGTRLWGHHSVRFLVDPIDYTTQQLDATVAYQDKRLQLTGGYYGTDFVNALTNVATPVGGGLTPIALPPANQSHQFYLSGGYGFTPTTRGTFKVAYGRITQEQTFFGVTPVLAGLPSNLGGRIDTTQAQVGISSRPMPKLTLRADLRYEDRDDQTPIYLYTTPGGTFDGRNEPRSFKTTVGKLDASYLLPNAFRLSGGVEYDQRKRNTSDIRAVSFRDETEETSLRVELRRSLAETLNGALSLVVADRTGSEWRTNTVVAGTVGSNLVHPLHLADRERNKVRLLLDWIPTEPLSINFIGEATQDDYSGRTLGPRSGESTLLSVDAAYQFTDAWQATAWASRTDTRAEQSSCQSATGTGVCGNVAGQVLWDADLRNLGTAFGVGVRGKAAARIELQADLSFSDDRGEFRQSATAAAAPVIPDVNYEVTSVKLQGRYALSPASGVRLQYIYDRFKTDDWYWTNFVYGDGTTVRQDPDQQVHFVSLSYYLGF